MAKPTSKPQLSLECAHIDDDAAGIPEDDWCRLFFEHIYCSFDDAEFECMYQDGGRYPVSPALLACITILQYKDKVSDRQAVRASILWRDWRIALGRTKDWLGFDPSVLCNFRKRLVANKMGRKIFDDVLDKLRELGLLSNRPRVRVDATHLVANVAVLSRPDAIREAIRIVVCDLHKSYLQLRERPDLLRLHKEYGKEEWLGRASTSDQSLTELGRDGQALLELCGELAVKGKEVLAQMLEENFIFSDNEDPKPLEPDERPKDHIVTPHEPDVRVGKKGDKIWTGDKVHFTETADKGKTNFILDVMTTDPRVEDSTVTEELAQRARFLLPDAKQLLGDGGYASAQNTKLAAAIGFDLITPPRAGNSKGRIPVTEFDIDFGRQVATCPEGHESVVWSLKARSIHIRFPAAACAACPRRAECTTSKHGRNLHLSKHYEQLVLDRERAQQPQFAELYRLRAAIEATISELVHCCGLRRSRYRDGPKRELHALFAATALNVRRLLHCLASENTPNEGVCCAFSRVLRAALAWLQAPLGAILSRILGRGQEHACGAFCPS